MPKWRNFAKSGHTASLPGVSNISTISRCNESKDQLEKATFVKRGTQTTQTHPSNRVTSLRETVKKGLSLPLLLSRIPPLRLLLGKKSVYIEKKKTIEQK